ncbi:phosphoesterase DHHA1 [Pyrolobus fumarii 1A]|uniref:Phosphoesterase DHHA1 n=1 Tax=Pyrolobus fumarii (strain DSM 11204 / 1A) TaxID=694429 RepID=G0ED00_PYRF1|nr:DHHA1 domain-containing protein [Pyrolobus fumarii]AEM39720.1 phosphoesterase DHHA1 [Pyrolobus fumarii 1A]
MPWRLSIITHTDLDGVSAAAIALRLAGARLGEDARLEFTEPYKLHKTLKSVARSASPGETIIIADIGANPSTLDAVVSLLREAVGRGARIAWFDHHRWEESWKEKLRDIGADIYVDNDTCGAGVVARYAPEILGGEIDDFIEDLVGATCAADIWIWDHPAAPKLYRVVDWKRGCAGDKWRRRLVEKFASAKSLQEILGDEEVQRALMEYVNTELRNYTEAVRAVQIVAVNGCKAVVALKKSGPPSRSFLARTLAARYRADLVVVIHKRGLSFRSEKVNVRELAKYLGGGGHLRAAGAPLAMPILWRIASIFYPKLRLRWAARRVEEALRAVGCRELPADHRVD